MICLVDDTYIVTSNATIGTMINQSGKGRGTVHRDLVMDAINMGSGVAFAAKNALNVTREGR